MWRKGIRIYHKLNMYQSSQKSEGIRDVIEEIFVMSYIGVGLMEKAFYSKIR